MVSKLLGLFFEKEAATSNAMDPQLASLHFKENQRRDIMEMFSARTVAGYWSAGCC
jgi:hypothetical protein